MPNGRRRVEPSGALEADRRPSEAATDNRLLEAWRAGDRLALERLLTPHERPLYLLCLGVLRSPEDAEDAVQEAFLRALRSLPRFRGDASVRTWLYRIAVNVCLERKRSRRPTVPIAEAVRQASCEPPVDEAATDHLRALDALGSLSPHQRVVVLLKDRDGWSTQEIASAMGWNGKRVENELYRARRALGRWRAEFGGA